MGDPIPNLVWMAYLCNGQLLRSLLYIALRVMYSARSIGLLSFMPRQRWQDQDRRLLAPPPFIRGVGAPGACVLEKLAQTHSNSLRLAQTRSNNKTVSFKLARTRSDPLKLAQTKRFKLNQTRSNPLRLAQTRSNKKQFRPHSLKLTQTRSNSLKLTQTRSDSLKLAQTRETVPF